MSVDQGTAADKDDRWSSFVDSSKGSNLGGRKTSEPRPQLNDYLGKVLLQRSPTQRQERKYRVACTLVQGLVDYAYILNTPWKAYVTTDNKMGVRTTPLRTLSEDKYDCMVPLVRPMRLDAFKIVQRGVDEMPQHRCLIQVNPALCKEEQRLVKNDWEAYLNKKGYLKPKTILSWFNTGLTKACATIKKESHNVDQLFCTVGDDGTATVHATATEFMDDELFIDNFTVNIFPVFVLDKLPSSLKLTAPLPCFGPYIQGQKAFRELVLKDLEDGKHVAFLDPKTEPSKGAIKGCLSPEGPSWKLNLSFTEYHVYSLIDRYCRGLNFRHVLVLLNIMREQSTCALKLLNNDILINTLFAVSHRHIDSLRSKQGWLLKMLGTLHEALSVHFLPSFHLPRLNLLSVYGIREEDSKAAAEEIGDILAAIKEDPKHIYSFTGYEEKKEDKDDEEIDNAEANKKEAESDNDSKDIKENRNDNKKDDVVRQKSSIPVIKEESVLNVDTDLDVESSRVYTCLMANTGEESGISKLSRRAERSDIY